MALHMLVNGAECGPINPLQGLSKQFDKDRGLQQDHFGAPRAGPSREVFRTQSSGPSQQDRDDAARFFSPTAPSRPQLSTATSFNMSAMNMAMPFLNSSPNFNDFRATPSANWAADFMIQQPSQSAQQLNSAAGELQQTVRPSDGLSVHALTSMQYAGHQSWNPGASSTYRMSPVQNNLPPMHTQSLVIRSQNDQVSWDTVFASQDNISSISALQTRPQQSEQSVNHKLHDPDELARTAGLLLETVKSEENPKFQNSAFMGLMKQLRDREMVVEGNEVVANTGDNRSATDSSWAPDFQKADLKGKGRARDVSDAPQMHNPGIYSPALPTQNTMPSPSTGRVEESAEDAFWRQENEDYKNYWQQNGRFGPLPPSMDATWGKLQQDWDRFEATETGIKPVNIYQFQANNPYLSGDSSRTRHHSMHSYAERGSLLESVLELEAAVQRDPSDATAWYELGIKQQENEREKHALAALERSVALDPSHLPTWLALAISYTNDGQRTKTYEATREWVQRNEKYKTAVQEYFSRHPENPNALPTERFDHLARCLMTMARSGMDDIDADIQIALAVLFNTNEEYEKSQDCFQTALAIRPNDWLLYNRVGATMANNGHAEQALQYYYKALELNSGYIRARYNLGISCINLRRFSEAAHHILDALVLQDADGVHDAAGMNEKRGVTSTALWDSLKTTCLNMQRVDLATLCDKHDLEGIRLAF